MTRRAYNKKFLSPAVGFTLVEVLVSVALFSLVMVMALGALVDLSSAVRRAEALDTATNNLSAAFDSMFRTIRIGTTYHCGSGGSLSLPNDCADLSSAAPSFTFQDASNPSVQVTYCLSSPNALTCNSSTACVGGSCTILRSKNGGPLIPLTSPEINIKSLKFLVSGASQGDAIQPKVVVLLVGAISLNQDITSNFNLQTSITQRLYDQ